MLDKINADLQLHLQNALPEHKFKDVLEYAVFPAGKLFRPQLVIAMAKDLGEVTESHRALASSIEIHHAYTLVHDDLPAMDDDDMRRGKASTHIKFSEWEAILAGDALLNYSFQLLAQVNSKYLPKIISLYGECTGAKGLILGQVMDLESEEKDFEQVLSIHSLKTSCLIQLALQGSNILSESKLEKTKVMNMGYALGIVFQLLDDLSELSETITEHEKEINPFLKFNQNVVFNELTNQLTTLHEVTCDHNLVELKRVIDSYLLKMKNKIESGKEQISKYVPEVESVFTIL